MKQLSLRILLALAIALSLVSASAFMVGQAASNERSAASILAKDSGPERIRFAAGATSAQVSGRLQARETRVYVLRAMAGQLMDVTLTAPEGTELWVARRDGRAVSAFSAGDTGFRGYLPVDGDYILEVSAGRQGGSYSLNVSIPERISFARGTTSASREGHVNAHQSHDYILRAGAGQILEVNVSPENSVQLIIFGVDGTVLRSGMGEGSSFRGELPGDQDYIVTVRAGDRAVDYTIDVIIPARISFARGAISGSASGWIAAHQSNSYVLRAMEGQEMDVEVSSRRPVQLIVYGADGTVLKSGMGEGTSFEGELPSTQDYILVVRAGEVSAGYTVSVVIR